MSFRKTIVAASGLLCCIFLIWRISYYTNWLDESVDSPDIWNLTKSEVSWRVYYGTPESCGKVDCHLLDSLPDSKFTKRAILPQQEWPLIGYESGQTVYVQTTVDLPDFIKSQLRRGITLVLQSTYIWARSYQLYINNRLVHGGSSETVFAYIPPDVLTNGRLSIAFKIDPGDLPYQGIAHRGYILLGPKDKLMGTIFQAKEIKTTFYLWFLLPVLTICLLFSILYLASYEYEDVFLFIVYGTVFATSLFLYTEYSRQIFTNFSGEVSGQFLEVLGQLTIILFVRKFFRKSGSLAFLGLFTASAIMSIIILAATYFSNPLLSRFTEYAVDYKLYSFLLLVSGFYGLYLSIETCSLLTATKTANPRRTVSLAFIGFFFMSSCLDIATLLGFDTSNAPGMLTLANQAAFFILTSSLVLYSLAHDHTNSVFAGTVVNMIQMFAHDVRRPYSRIKLLLPSLRDNLEDTSRDEDIKAETRKWLQQIEQAISDSERMLVDLLELRARGSGIRSTHSLRKALIELVDSLKVATTGISFQVILAHKSMVSVSEFSLRRVIGNIVQNAIDALGKSGGEIHIATRETSSSIEVVITNNGPVIPVRITKQIFEPFFSHGKTGSHGLGLAITRKLVEGWGGKIWCQSDEKEGTRFGFSVTAAPGQADQADSSFRSGGAERSKAAHQTVPDRGTVIVIDDDEVVLANWQHIYRKLEPAQPGLSLLTYSKPEDFVAAIETSPGLNEKIRYVIVDYYFPDSQYQTGPRFILEWQGRLSCNFILSSDTVEIDGTPLPGIRRIGKAVLKIEELDLLLPEDHLVS